MRSTRGRCDPGLYSQILAARTKRSTEYDSPGPATPTRVLCYNSIGLTVIFIPEASLSDKPPYKWKLVSFVDQQADTPITAGEALARFPQTE